MRISKKRDNINELMEKITQNQFIIKLRANTKDYQV